MTCCTLKSYFQLQFPIDELNRVVIILKIKQTYTRFFICIGLFYCSNCCNSHILQSNMRSTATLFSAYLQQRHFTIFCHLTLWHVTAAFFALSSYKRHLTFFHRRGGTTKKGETP